MGMYWFYHNVCVCFFLYVRNHDFDRKDCSGVYERGSFLKGNFIYLVEIPNRFTQKTAKVSYKSSIIYLL